jgi:histidinol dehydrogenase
MNVFLPEIRVKSKGIEENVARIRSRSYPLEIENSVMNVIREVQKKGDSALLRYAREFDKVDLSSVQIRINKDEIRSAVGRVDAELLSAMRFSLRRLQKSQRILLNRLDYSHVEDGFVIRVTSQPLSSVGCYVPGGRAVYASTVLMTAGLAQLAGVKRVVICTPSDPRGKVNDAILAAADLCGVNEVYRLGGAQAIAAMAYGTESLKKVEKIVGPGGIYVSVAKKLVSADIAIDFFAGPTELIVICDETADPRIVAWDLVGQAEHGEDSICGLVTWSKRIADEVRSEIMKLIPNLSRREFIEKCLRRGFAAICDDIRSAASFVNVFSPEHVELIVSKPSKFARLIENAGLVLSGPFSPCAAGDYCIGTDHVLPTRGSATGRGGLSVLDFTKIMYMVEGSREGLRSILSPLKALAYAEGLPNHYLSVESRFAN